MPQKQPMKYIPLFLLLFSLGACEWETSSTNTSNAINSTKETPNVNVAPTTPRTVSQPRSVNAQWLCIPGKQVGKIKSTSNEAAVIAAYGKENVVRRTIGLGEGETTEGTVVFPDTDNELIIEWADGQAFQKPAKIRIEKNNAQWKTDQGIGIGTTLAELQQINGKDFKFAGFEWDYAGFTNAWEGGKVNEKLTVFLDANNPEAVMPDLMGDELFSSSHPKAAAADLRVRSLVILF